MAYPAGDELFIQLDEEMRHMLNINPGDLVHIKVEPDPFPGPEAEVPDDLAHALERNPPAHAAFYRMPPSHRRRYVEWLNEASQPGTRACRLERILVMVTADVDPYHPQRGS